MLSQYKLVNGVMMKVETHNDKDGYNYYKEQGRNPNTKANAKQEIMKGEA
jgi:hypothetical protein